VRAFQLRLRLFLRISRVHERERTDLTCPECSAPMKLRDSRYGLFYGCTAFPKCKATHGAHPDGAPLGRPADKATKRARMDAHDAFDQLWKDGRMKRRAAYAWMRRALELSPEEAHIGMMDIETCQRLIEAVKDVLH
jgi:ssDNA-binding Zn-finger/Zn-ribbon topoisomerase 1